MRTASVPFISKMLVGVWVLRPKLLLDVYKDTWPKLLSVTAAVAVALIALVTASCIIIFVPEDLIFTFPRYILLPLR